MSLKGKIEAIEDQLKESYQESRRKLEREAISKTKHNPKAFYAYAKRFAKTFTGVGPLIKEDGKVITNPKEIAEMQKEQDQKVFTETKEDDNIRDITDFFCETRNNNKIENATFNYTDVREAIDKLSANAAAGPDGIPAILLKNARIS